MNQNTILILSILVSGQYLKNLFYSLLNKLRPRILSICICFSLFIFYTQKKSNQILILVSALGNLQHDELVEELEWRIQQLPHHRDKRFAFLTDEKRFVMPPGSQMVLTPTLALPVIR